MAHKRKAKLPLTESTADFKARLAAMNPRPIQTPEEKQRERPCVRTPRDRGYFPPEKAVSGQRTFQKNDPTGILERPTYSGIQPVDATHERLLKVFGVPRDYDCGAWEVDSKEIGDNET